MKTRSRHHTLIRVGQRLKRWDGESGYVNLNSRGTRTYEGSDEFQVIWQDGGSDYYTLATLDTEGVTWGRGVMPWAR